MFNHNISEVIEECCKKEGIEYHSPYLKYGKHHYQDAKRLAEIYRELKEIAGELQIIEERHNVNGLGQLLHSDLLKLDEIDHDIILVAKKIREQNNDN